MDPFFSQMTELEILSYEWFWFVMTLLGDMQEKTDFYGYRQTTETDTIDFEPEPMNELEAMPQRWNRHYS